MGKQLMKAKYSTALGSTPNTCLDVKSFDFFFCSLDIFVKCEKNLKATDFRKLKFKAQQKLSQKQNFSCIVFRGDHCRK